MVTKRFVEILGITRVIYGWSLLRGVFVDVYQDDDDDPVLELDAVFDGATVGDVIAAAEAHGALLASGRLLAAPAAFRLVRRESVK